MPKVINKYERRLLWLKRWIWVYFWLLIFEGVLRKWVVPSLSGPLLLVRDPVAVMIYIQAYRCRKFSMKTMWPFALLAAGLFLLASTQIVVGIDTIPIALYGLRSYLLHLPLIFVIADTLTKKICTSWDAGFYCCRFRCRFWCLRSSGQGPAPGLMRAQERAPARLCRPEATFVRRARSATAQGHRVPGGAEFGGHL